MENAFPPPLRMGSRVWTTHGYRDHGPLEGPQINVAPNMGGTISAINRRYFTMDLLLYTVQWDNGQVSKHYENGLFCIGRFQTPSEFEAAINITGPVELTVGPQGGFRQVKVALEYDGQPQDVCIYDRGIWFDCLEALAKKNRVHLHTIQLPGKSRRNRPTSHAT